MPTVTINEKTYTVEILKDDTYKVNLEFDTQGTISILPAKGEKGDPGEPGPANTLSIGTVQKGSTAAATITGTAPNQTLNLTLPKGDKGDTGDKGETGATGPANTLSIGTVTKGADAAATITGSAPNQTLNLTLPKGDKGNTGEKGDPGDDGYSPTVTVSKTGKVTTVTITDKNGDHVATINDGEDGQGAGDMLKSVYDTDNDGVVDNAEKVNNHTVESDVPAGATFPKVFYGTCATAAGTAAKVVTCENFAATDLVAGAILAVYMANANSYNGTASLNVNNTGANTIHYNGTTTNSRYMWAAGETVIFVFDGTAWATANGGLATTSYYGVTKLVTSASSDSQAYALTPRSLHYFADYSIAPLYSASSTYEIGDKVRHGYYLYECISAIESPEAWTVEHWQHIGTIQEQLDNKQDKLTAGTNVTIAADGTISATDTTYSAGTGISIENGVISCIFADGNGVNY